jgi:hypothetical protein
MDVLPPTRANPWGRHRTTLDEELQACEGFVQQMRAELDGESVPARRFVIERAHYLHRAANYLVRATQETERNLGLCEAIVEPPASGRAYDKVCTLPAGHTGDHDPHPPLTPGERLLEAARHLSDQTDQLTSRLAWLTTDVDRRGAQGHGPDDRHRQLIDQVSTKLRAVSYDSAKLAREAEDLLIGPERAVASSAPAAEAPSIEAPVRQLER